MARFNPALDDQFPVAVIVGSYRQHRGIVRELVIGVHGHSASDDQGVRAAMTELLERDIQFLLEALPGQKRKSRRKQVGLAVLAAINLIQNRVVFQATSPLEFKVSDRDLKQEIPKMVVAYLAFDSTGMERVSGKS